MIEVNMLCCWSRWSKEGLQKKHNAKPLGVTAVYRKCYGYPARIHISFVLNSINSIYNSNICTLAHEVMISINTFHNQIERQKKRERGSNVSASVTEVFLVLVYPAKSYVFPLSLKSWITPKLLLMSSIKREGECNSFRHSCHFPVHIV